MFLRILRSFPEKQNKIAMCMLSYRDKVEYVPKKIFVVT